MEERKCEIREVLFWGDEIFKPNDLVVLQDKCENIYKGRIVQLKRGSISEKKTYTSEDHIILDTSDEFNSKQLPIILDEIETLEFRQASSDNSCDCAPGCTCKPGTDQPGTGTGEDQEPTQTPDVNPDESGGEEGTQGVE